MRYQVVIAGFGGQGAVFLVKVLALCAGNKNIECLGTENHGMSQRGGAVSCFIKLGDFSNPVIDTYQADLLIGLEADEALRNMQYLKSGGIMAVNAEDDFPAADVYTDVARVDAFAKAKAGDFPIQGLNVYMLGVAARNDKNFPFTLEDLKEAITQMNAKVAAQNIEILEKGYANVME